jgi:hypothetical protein
LGNKIGRITTAGAITEFPIPTADSQPSGITAGPDGALWFTEAVGNKIGRITTSGVITEFSVPSPDSGPSFIAAGPDGALWFTESRGNKIGRITVASAATRVAIDIKPGSNRNSINPRSRGRVAVAILATDSFDATTVNLTTVRFGPTGTEAAPVHSAPEDVDGDGDTDLVLHFNTEAAGIACGDTSSSLTGETVGGHGIEGSDSVSTVGCH